MLVGLPVVLLSTVTVWVNGSEVVKDMAIGVVDEGFGFRSVLVTGRPGFKLVEMEGFATLLSVPVAGRIIITSGIDGPLEGKLMGLSGKAGGINGNILDCQELTFLEFCAMT